jgi:hypothetical protein
VSWAWVRLLVSWAWVSWLVSWAWVAVSCELGLGVVARMIITDGSNLTGGRAKRRKHDTCRDGCRVPCLMPLIASMEYGHTRVTELLRTVYSARIEARNGNVAYFLAAIEAGALPVPLVQWVPLLSQVARTELRSALGGNSLTCQLQRELAALLI